jgi:hypothetical protein
MSISVDTFCEARSGEFCFVSVDIERSSAIELGTILARTILRCASSSAVGTEQSDSKYVCSVNGLGV